MNGNTILRLPIPLHLLHPLRKARERLTGNMLPLPPAVLFRFEFEHPAHRGAGHHFGIPSRGVWEFRGEVEFGTEKVMNGVFIALDEG